jgi:acetyl-CoA carboxylase/biotin carboxylase 1
VDYCNAGTVEYLFSEETQGFYFLELNPRLQVEHPVTEMITHVNMPAAQLQVAMGIPLGNIPDIRSLYNKPRFGDCGPVDLAVENQKPPHGHVIAARITAENPDAGFQPTSGLITELNFRSTPDVWGYFSLDSHGQVHEFADSQFGHVFSWGATRKIACKNAVMALKELSIRGDIRTTVEYIIKMMQSEDFNENRISTNWLDDRIARHKEIAAETQLDCRLVVTVGAAVQAYKVLSQRFEDYTAALERGQLPPSELLQPAVNLQLIFGGVKFKLHVEQSGPISFTLRCNGSEQVTDVRSLSDGGFLVMLEGQSHVAYMTQEAGGLRLVIDGQTCMFLDEYDPTRICANTAGKLIQFLVDDGAHVDKGSPYAEIEVMKMLMPLLAPESGTLSQVKPEGSVLEAGDLIAGLALDDPSCVIQSKDFTESLVMSADHSGKTDDTGAKPQFILRRAASSMERALEGFCVAPGAQELALSTVLKQLRNKHMPVYELEEALFVLSGRIDGGLFDTLNGMLAKWWGANGRDEAKGSAPDTAEFDTAAFSAAIRAFHAALPANEKVKFEASVAELEAICAAYSEGMAGKEASVVSGLLGAYYELEKLFVGKTREDTEMELRATHKDDLNLVYNTMRSHELIGQKNNLCLLLLKHFAAQLESNDSASLSLATTRYSPLLKQIASLVGLCFAPVTQAARQLLLCMRSGSVTAARASFVELCKGAVAAGPPGSKERAMSLLAPGVGDAVRSTLTAALQDFLVDEPADLRAAALEGYVMRLYRAYQTNSLDVKLPASDGVLAVHWTFKGELDESR